MSLCSLNLHVRSWATVPHPINDVSSNGAVLHGLLPTAWAHRSTSRQSPNGTPAQMWASSPCLSARLSTIHHPPSTALSIPPHAQRRDVVFMLDARVGRCGRGGAGHTSEPAWYELGLATVLPVISEPALALPHTQTPVADQLVNKGSSTSSTLRFALC